MRFFLALLTLLSCLTSAGAERGTGTLVGRVSSQAAGAPLAGAHVSLSIANMATITDAQGDFYLPAVPVGEVRISISHVGFRTRELRVVQPAAETLKLSVELIRDLLPLPGIIVTARGRNSSLANLAGSAGVLSGVELTDHHPVSIPAAVSDLAGVSLATDMPWSGRVCVRGMSRDHVALLIDGNRVSTTTALAAQYGTVAAADVERLEVLKGPVSVLYGTGSTGGVVNIIPHSGQFSPGIRWSGATSMGYESVSGGLSSYVRASLGTPRSYLMISQSYRDYSSYQDGSGDRIPNSQFTDYQSHVNAGVRLSSAHALDFRYQWFEARDVGIPGAGGVFPDPATVTYPHTRRWLAQATWKYQRPVPAWQRSELRIFLQTLNRGAEVAPNTVKSVPATDSMPARRVRPQLIEPSADHDARGFRWNNVVALGTHDLVFGVEGWEKEVHSQRRRTTEIDVLAEDGSVVTTSTSIQEDRSLPTSTYRPIGAYVEDEFTAMEGLTLSGGVRVDVIQIDSETTYLSYVPASNVVLWQASDDTDYSFSAQARATCQLTPHVEAYVNLARSFRSPGLEERFLYVDLGSLVRIGDPELDSENGHFVEIGLSGQTDHTSWNGQAFRNRIRNMVIESPSVFEDRQALRKTNAGEALLWGLETRLAFTPRPDMLLSANVAYVRGTDEKAEADLPAMPPLNAQLTARYGNRVWCQAQLDLVADQHHVAPGEQVTGGHRTLDLSAGVADVRRGDLNHRVTLGLRNVFSTEYRDHLTTSRGFDLNAPGRSVYVTWAAEL